MPPCQNRPRAILFDCWNTLFHYDALSARAWDAVRSATHSRLFRPVSRRYEVSLMRTPIDDPSTAARVVLERFGVLRTDAAVSWLARYLDASRYRHAAYADALPTLVSLKSLGFRLGLVTNTTKMALDPVRAAYGLDALFDAVVPSYEVGCLKPNPDIYLTAIQRLQLAPQDVLMVGDNLRDDVLGPEALGIRGVLLDRSTRADRHLTRIRALDDLLAVVNQWGNACD